VDGCGGVAVATVLELMVVGSESPADELSMSRSSFLELVAIAVLQSLGARGLFSSWVAVSPCAVLSPATVGGRMRGGDGGCDEDGGLEVSGFFSVVRWCHLVGLYPLLFTCICTAFACFSLPYIYK
jgi:hypothetical protein